jgi:hypothetical protein
MVNRGRATGETGRKRRENQCGQQEAEAAVSNNMTRDTQARF